MTIDVSALLAKGRHETPSPWHAMNTPLQPLNLNQIKPENAESFLTEYERNVLQRDPGPEWQDECSSLVSLYNYLGKTASAQDHFCKAIEWFEKAEALMENNDFLCLQCPEVFINLSYCHQEMLHFEKALVYLNRYQFYKSEEEEACRRLRRNIELLQDLYEGAID